MTRSATGVLLREKIEGLCALANIFRRFFSFSFLSFSFLFFPFLFLPSSGMTSRNTPFPPAAASAFGSRKARVDDRGAFPQSKSGAPSAFDDRASRAFGSGGSSNCSARNPSAFDDRASRAFGAGDNNVTRNTSAFDDRASHAFGSGGSSGSSGNDDSGVVSSAFDDRASHAFGKKSKAPLPTTSSVSTRGNTFSAHISAALGESAVTLVGRPGSVLFKKKKVDIEPVKTMEEMFPALSAPMAQKTALPKASFVDLVKKRAQDDETERSRTEVLATTQRDELKRAERDRAHLKTIYNIRAAFHKKNHFEEEEFYDDGEAYIRPEDVEQDVRGESPT
jgi:hypothetical protein